MHAATEATVASGSIAYRLGAKDRAESRSLLQRAVNEEFDGVNPLGAAVNSSR